MELNATNNIDDEWNNFIANKYENENDEYGQIMDANE